MIIDIQENDEKLGDFLFGDNQSDLGLIKALTALNGRKSLLAKELFEDGETSRGQPASFESARDELDDYIEELKIMLSAFDVLEDAEDLPLPLVPTDRVAVTFEIRDDNSDKFEAVVWIPQAAGLSPSVKHETITPPDLLDRLTQ